MVLDPVIGKYSQLPDSGMVYRQICIMQGALLWEQMDPKSQGRSTQSRAAITEGCRGKAHLCTVPWDRARRQASVHVQSLSVASPPHSLTHHRKRGSRGFSRIIFSYGARLSQKISFLEATFPVWSFPEGSEMPKGT